MIKNFIIWTRIILPIIILMIMVFSPVSQLVRTARQDPLPYKESPILQNEKSRDFLFNNDIKWKSTLESFYDDISGGAYSLKIYFLKLAEPFTAFAVSIRNFYKIDFWNWQLLFAFFIPIFIGFLFGRVYCSYVCPWSLLVNLNLKVRKKIFKYIPASSASLLQNIPRWRFYYFVGFLLITIFNPVLIQFFLPAAIIQNGFSDFILFGGFSLWMLAFFILLLFEVFRPAYFCRNLCPTGLFLSYLGHFRVFKLGYNRKKACPKSCESCISSCWLGLNPKQRAQDPACDLCARCVKVCPTERLKIEHKKPYKIEVLLTFLALILIGCTGPDLKGNFGDEVIKVTLFEASKELIGNKGKRQFEASYSFVTDEKSQFEGAGEMTFNLHIRNENTIFSSPLTIETNSSKKVYVPETLIEPNRPISIIRRSVYQVKIPFYKHEIYTINISSADEQFKSFEIVFSYPRNRF